VPEAASGVATNSSRRICPDTAIAQHVDLCFFQTSRFDLRSPFVADTEEKVKDKIDLARSRQVPSLATGEPSG
jgi:hypothetical protein